MRKRGSRSNRKLGHGWGKEGCSRAGVEMLCSTGCLWEMLGACKAGTRRQGRSDLGGWRTETTCLVFPRHVFPNFMDSSVQRYKKQRLSAVRDQLGSWSFTSEQDAGKGAARLEGAAGRMLTPSHSPLPFFQLPLISMAKGWLPRHRQM